MKHDTIGLVAACTLASNCSAQRVLQAHGLPWTIGFSPTAALFFDLEATRQTVVVEGFAAAVDWPPGMPFTVEVLIRDGTSLGGSATSGPGATHDGWTSLGVVQGHQGPISGGISDPVLIPRFQVSPGHSVGVALDFYDSPPATALDSAQYRTYSDDALRMTTGDVRSPSFNPSQHYFRWNQLVGSILYDLAPCYPNCDGSTLDPVLNVNDFLCFMSRFAAGDPYANCDQSTTPPILSVNDFLCFTQQFAAGCS